jgi:hypothetical protein
MIVCKDWLKKYLGYYHPGYYVFIINGVLGTKIEVLENTIPLANDHHKKKHKKPCIVVTLHHLRFQKIEGTNVIILVH